MRLLFTKWLRVWHPATWLPPNWARPQIIYCRASESPPPFRLWRPVQYRLLQPAEQSHAFAVCVRFVRAAKAAACRRAPVATGDASPATAYAAFPPLVRRPSGCEPSLLTPRSPPISIRAAATPSRPISDVARSANVEPGPRCTRASGTRLLGRQALGSPGAANVIFAGSHRYARARNHPSVSIERITDAISGIACPRLTAAAGHCPRGLNQRSH